jgi:hypothetical protein
MHSTARHPRHSSPLFTCGLALGAAGILIAGCTSDDSEDLGDSDRVTTVEHYPELRLPSAAELAEAESRLVARLEVEDYGRISIVNIGTENAPDYSYFTVGGNAIDEILQQLLDEDATPAEVFIALAEGEVLPVALAIDQELRAEAGDAEGEPRTLNYEVFRTNDTVALDCYTSGTHQSFASWVSEWQTSFGSYWDSPNSYSDEITVFGTHVYSIGADSARAMSVCDARLTTGSSVVVVTFQAQQGPNWLTVYNDTLSDYEAARTYSSGGSYSAWRVSVVDDGPAVRTYVAYGNCDGNSYPC